MHPDPTEAAFRRGYCAAWSQALDSLTSLLDGELTPREHEALTKARHHIYRLEAWRNDPNPATPPLEGTDAYRPGPAPFTQFELFTLAVSARAYISDIRSMLSRLYDILHQHNRSYLVPYSADNLYTNWVTKAHIFNHQLKDLSTAIETYLDHEGPSLKDPPQ